MKRQQKGKRRERKHEVLALLEFPVPPGEAEEELAGLPVPV